MTDIVDPLRPTRVELAKFLPTQRLIKAFEKIFDLLPSSINDNAHLIEQTNNVAESAVSAANAAVAELERIADALEALVNAPRHEPVEPENDLSPRHEIGTISSQNSDDVEVTGGTVTATLTNDQAILLATSTVLIDGAAAAIGTLTNAPTAGNPTKWVAINDNGTTRYIPAW